MKSVDEVKKGLKAHAEDCCCDCPYWDDCNAEDAMVQLAADALALIQQLTEEGEAAIRRANVLMERVQQLEAERDAAVACIPRECGYCKHDGTADFDVDSVCDYCLNGNTRWEWRGVQKEEAK